MHPILLKDISAATMTFRSKAQQRYQPDAGGGDPARPDHRIVDVSIKKLSSSWNSTSDVLWLSARRIFRRPLSLANSLDFASPWKRLRDDLE